MESGYPTPDSMRSSQSGPRPTELAVDVGEDDINADPESSSDIEDAKDKYRAGASFVKLSDIIPGDEKESSKATKPFALPGAKNNRDTAADDGEPDWMAERRAPKRRKVTATFTNLHAKAPPTKTYGSQKSSSQPKKNGFKTTSRMVPEQRPEKRSVFKKLSAFELPAEETSSGFKSSFSTDNVSISGDQPNPLNGSRSSSPDHATDEPDEPDIYSSDVECPHCRERVSRMIYEEFEDRIGFKGAMPYKWERYFCGHHKKESAGETWREKGYPTIDWLSLEGRLRKHDEFLECILNGSIDSHYRTRLEDKLQPRKKGILQSYENEDDKGCGVGYYGPRGAKLMYVSVVQ